MHLKSLTLKGFKSFASATTLALEPGICAVVGPNGSGKSNVVDALAWVMGEQGAKTLRGGKMEDVIFAGAGDRKPLGRAEVTLTIDNSDGALPIEYSEVSVTRRMYRDGASEYEINGAKARLMDIQELLSDSGIGREMHVIVGQGRLAQILESRPEERRAFIEEAAGVLKHRRRREKAQRKLTSMQGNLDRLHDLTDELRTQLKPLARQAEAAQRAATVQARIREARLTLAADTVRELSEELSSTESRAAALAERLSGLTATVEEQTEELTVMEEELRQALEAAEAARSLWYRLSSVAERNAATIRIAADRADDHGAEAAWSGPDPAELLARAERLDEEQLRLDEEVEIASERLDAVREDVAERDEAARAAEKEHLARVRAVADRREGLVRLLASQESAEARRTSLEAEVGRLTQTVEEQQAAAARAQAEAEEARGEADAVDGEGDGLATAGERAEEESRAADARVAELRAEERDIERTVASLTARIDTWEDQLRPRDGGDVAARAATALDLGELSPLAGAVTAHAGWERALSAVLAAGADGLAGSVDPRVLAALEEADAGRALLLDRREAAGWRLDAEVPDGARWLLDLVDAPDDLRFAVASLLVDVVAVDGVEAARDVVENDPRLRAVTRTGTVVGAGWAAAGSGGTTPVELAGKVAAARGERDDAVNRLSDLQAGIGAAEETAAERRTAAAAARAAAREHRGRVEAATRRATATARTAEETARQLRRARDQRDDAERRLAEVVQECDDVADRLARVDDDGHEEEPSTDERDRAAAALTEARAMEMEARLALRTAEERAGAGRGRADGLRRQARQEQAAREQFERSVARRRAAREVAAAVHAEAQRVDARIRDALDRAERQRTITGESHTRWQSSLSRKKDEVNALTTQLGRLNDTVHEVELARSQAQLKLEQALEQAMEQLGMNATELAAAAPEGPVDRTATRKELAAAEKDLRSLGKVNPLALEEYAALEERYRFLAEQLDDVERARADLEGVIRDVDDTILQLFTDAWRDVEAEFPTVFATLFPGGAGRLVLTDPDDMLTTGIEVEARPPGKKVKRLTLLSGGEKSLTALAMLVAIFRARPSPFYVMDEVEAALDDVNLRRLIALFEELRKDSQLIVITHQKPTMDVANVLYGVTMRGDGVTRVISQRMNPAGAVS
ncbi:chromosome segregation protein SMC [Corynebacterium bovis]|uniref:chromosome segregation protein SMC n=2 Tax=Corynebacterium bovis TaxID=36808 RepID=UPI000F64F80F|nr:chromosome segregation protein SMC [Corynebacterium bovis]RRO89711.1 chromosome segregation protein SMC [Corynebacterium bovis]RRQ14393.1 chromosome segregation protein SMC [Corynebacterium bovis]RRQ16661.1 chromosome segregation protein SMC [Corynebacterium bovis]